MLHSQILTSVLFLSPIAVFTLAQTTQEDFTGTGHISVLASADWTHANPSKDRVGCLAEDGSFVNAQNKTACGVFSRLDEYPWTLSTAQGNCTFTDERAEPNTDSHYGRGDHAWTCVHGYVADIYDELYTITGFPHVFLCFGDVACYYDAKRVPERGAEGSLWQFRWGSQQMGITPGHVQLMLLWEKVGELPKREGEAVAAPGPRVRVQKGQRVLLGGRRVVDR